MRWPALFVFLAAIVCLAGCRDIPRDDITGSQNVCASGYIVRRIFPGPPEFTSIAQGDRPSECWVLIADQPVKNTAPTQFGQPIPAEGVKELQLFLNDDQYSEKSPLFGKHVEIRGICSWAAVGGNYTPLLIEVKDIRLYKK